MKIVCISDTHNFHSEIKVPDGDILIHSGDATTSGTIKEVAAFAYWFGGLPHKWKIFVPGNHDWLFQTDPSLAESILGQYGIVYLRDWRCEIDGVQFYGSPWTPEFGWWAFMLPRGKEIAQKWAQIPSDVDVLITHGPPHGILDEISGLCVGCHELYEAVRIAKPKFHVFGHIHGGHGRLSLAGTEYINAAICDESYAAVNEPITFEI